MSSPTCHTLDPQHVFSGLILILLRTYSGTVLATILNPGRTDTSNNNVQIYYGAFPHRHSINYPRFHASTPIPIPSTSTNRPLRSPAPHQSASSTSSGSRITSHSHSHSVPLSHPHHNTRTHAPPPVPIIIHIPMKTLNRSYPAPKPNVKAIIVSL